MILIDPSVTLLESQDIIKDIARAAHLCYKQDNSKIPDVQFVESLIKRKHMAMLEHATVYLTVNYDNLNDHDAIDTMIRRYERNPYSKVVSYSTDVDGEYLRKIFITTNYRVIVENGWQDDLKYHSTPSGHHELRYSFHIVTDRATATQFLRYRKMSFAMESQRFCNYSLDRFGGEITYCIPYWYYSSKLSSDYKEASKAICFEQAMKNAEESYLKNISLGMPAEDARCVLPNQTKTELIVTGFASDWQHVIDQRLKGLTGRPEPEIKLLAEKIDKLINNKQNI